MTGRGFAGLVFVALCSASGAAAGQGAEEKTKVEVAFAAEHVPADLKAGARVDLLRVDGKTAAGRMVLYRTAVVVPNVEVASVTRAEKPKEPEQAVKVELLATKEQAALIEKAKRALVTVVENRPGAPPETKRRPVTLRLEPANQPDKK
jgi:hypothetical protein